MEPSWADFFSILAETSVALLALLFVSFQIAREKWVTNPSRRLIAVQTLLEFLTPSFFAIIALLPIKEFIIINTCINVWQIGGVFTSIFGLITCYVIVKYGINNRNNIDKFFKTQLILQILSITEYLAIFISSLDGNLLLTSILMIWLLLSGSFETWLFFSELDSRKTHLPTIHSHQKTKLRNRKSTDLIHFRIPRRPG